MNWTQFLKTEIEITFATADKLLDKVDPSSLDWKPATGSNWMTVGQLLKHMSDGCGAGMKAFVTGDWGLPPGVKPEDLSAEEMMPLAEKLPTIDSVASTKEQLSKDKKVALEMVDQAGESELATRTLSAPWAPGQEYILGWHLHQMVLHLDRHKSQLFYYLKLQGKSVSTGDLWG